jgi:hypothetical protein
VGIGVSLFLIAVGAVLTFAVEVEAEGFNINTIGIILMVVGAVGLFLSLMFWSSWGGFTRRNGVSDATVVRRRQVIDDEI